MKHVHFFQHIFLLIISSILLFGGCSKSKQAQNAQKTTPPAAPSTTENSKEKKKTPEAEKQPGPTGPQGPQGPVGPRGPEGATTPGDQDPPRICHKKVSNSLLVMAYNLENMFDAEHDKVNGKNKEDYEYLPKAICQPAIEAKLKNCVQRCQKKEDAEKTVCEDKCHKNWRNNHKSVCKKDWTREKYTAKLNQLKKVFDLRKTEFKENSYPDIVGFSEIENEEVTKKIASMLGYEHQVTTNGPDIRGIDVAILFKESDQLKFVSSKEHIIRRVKEEGTSNGKRFGGGRHTRPILEVHFKYFDKPLFVFMNHWPSLAGDTNNRVFAAEMLRKVIERRAHEFPEAHFLAMGDFNTHEIIEKQSGLPHPFHDVLLKGKRGLSPQMLDLEVEVMKTNLSLAKGSHFYKGDWQSLDRMFISQNLLDCQNSEVRLEDFKIFDHKELSTPCQPKSCPADNGELIPHRYNHEAEASDPNQGFSDHYPIYVRINLMN